ncbi:MAG: 50S ribosomal protein L10 [Fimbriimonadaceae bacterium]|nr:50S ribosomal protein L10 [Fimbriimonadaceae bacterium]
MPTADKIRVVEETTERLARAGGVFLTEYRGLTVPELQSLRSNLRAKGGELKVLKNTLFLRALGDKAEILNEEATSGPTAVAFAYENESECAKVLLDFAKTNKALVVKGGMVDGKYFDAAGVEKFSKLPTRDQLISMVIGAISAPISNLVGTIEALYAQPIRTIGAVADKVAEGSPIPAPANAAAAEPEAAPAEETTTEDASPAESASDAPAEEATTPEESSEPTAEETTE